MSQAARLHLILCPRAALNSDRLPIWLTAFQGAPRGRQALWNSLYASEIW